MNKTPDEHKAGEGTLFWDYELGMGVAVLDATPRGATFVVAAIYDDIDDNDASIPPGWVGRDVERSDNIANARWLAHGEVKATGCIDWQIHGHACSDGGLGALHAAVEWAHELCTTAIERASGKRGMA